MDDEPNKTRRRITPQHKPEDISLCLQEGLSCNTVAHRLGLSSSSLVRWVLQSRSDQVQAGYIDQDMQTIAEREELKRLRKESWELRTEKGFIRLASAHFPT